MGHPSRRVTTGNGRSNEEDARAGSQEVGQRDEAEMGCGSGGLGAAARLGSRLITLCGGPQRLYQGTPLAVPLKQSSIKRDRRSDGSVVLPEKQALDFAFRMREMLRSELQ